MSPTEFVQVHKLEQSLHFDVKGKGNFVERRKNMNINCKLD